MNVRGRLDLEKLSYAFTSWDSGVQRLGVHSALEAEG